jgi:hypothetical protein
LIIGLAPLILGSAVVILIGYHIFDVGAMIEAAKTGDGSGILEMMQVAFGVNDAWIWLYLIFAVSNAMLPSESDRESLWPMVAFIASIVGLAVLGGWGPALMNNLSEPVEAFLSLLLVAFGITLFVDAIFVAAMALFRESFSVLTGRRLEKET